MAVLEALKSLDAYPKISLDDRDFRNKTIGGAASKCSMSPYPENEPYFHLITFLVTVISTIVMVFLLISEVVTYLQPNITEDLFVDTTRSHKLKINLDLYIPTISCNCMWDLFT